MLEHIMLYHPRYFGGTFIRYHIWRHAARASPEYSVSIRPPCQSYAAIERADIFRPCFGTMPTNIFERLYRHQYCIMKDVPDIAVHRAPANYEEYSRWFHDSFHHARLPGYRLPSISPAAATMRRQPITQRCPE